MKILFICGALAAGEFVASYIPTCADVWPFMALLTVLIVLFGYGVPVRGWSLAATFLAGMALFLLASVEQEHLYREKPWLRGCLSHMQRTGSSPNGFAAGLKDDFSRRVGLGIDADREVVTLNRAILLGERFRLSQRLKRVFAASGTMHVFAISGLHVMAIANVLIYFLAALLVPRRLAGVFVMPFLWGYVHLIGLPPSAVRATLMASVCFLAPVLWRRPNLLRAWALTFLAVHILHPRMIVDVGNILSFTVMLAIALVVEYGLRTGLRVSFCWITVAVWAVGVPIAAHVFGQVAPGGILANLVLITAAEWTVYTGAIGVIISFASESVAGHFNNLSVLCTKAMVGISEFVSRLPGSSFEVSRWTILQCVEWYALIALIAFLVHLVRQRRF